ncbi:MAG: DUF2752 domain-containing protein [Ruminococcaceae bacterium]|nr:DUF2752 domain-containing protein [Oscillospiraceae bacterium]
MKKEQKERIIILIKNTLPVLVILLLYYFFVLITGIGIPCIFKKITGLRCPGCGISRMFMALFSLDFVKAARYNILVLSLLPFFVSLVVYKAIIYVKSGETKNTLFEKVFYPIVFILCIVFTVVRNMGIIEFITL